MAPSKLHSTLDNHCIGSCYWLAWS